MTFGSKAFKYLSNLHPDFKLPRGVKCLLPFATDETIRVNKIFFEKYYNDVQPRRLILGINPGRFGAGITGVAFTDPIRLETELGIENSFQKKPELSSVFIYQMIDAFGGPSEFYSRFFLSAVCPVGFVQDGKNVNYYDLPELEKSARPFILESIKKHMAFGADRKVAFCLGEGKNFRFLLRLNAEEQLFESIVPLAHPRFIMQYKRRYIADYIKSYVDHLNN